MGQQEHDNYPTPNPLASAIIRTVAAWRPSLGLPSPDVFIEPSCGEGSFIKAARETWPNSFIAGADIVPSYNGKVIEAGANTFFAGDLEQTIAAIFASVRTHVGTAVVGGNPPFSLAQRHIELLMQHLLQGEWLFFLLRLSFMGSAERANTFWPTTGKQQRFLIPIAGRPSYVTFKMVEETEEVITNGYPQTITHQRRKKTSTTDNSEYGVYIFEKGYQGPCIRTDPLVWKPQRSAA